MKLGLSVLRELPETDPDRLAAVGYCFGGTGVLELARAGADVKAVVSFHGGLDSPNPEDGANIQASVLMLHASHDPTTPPEQIDALVAELDTHNVDWQLNYYAHHGHHFTDPEHKSGYNPVADRRSWAAALHFLEEHLKE
jgi:dienelactone hydrolase